MPSQTARLQHGRAGISDLEQHLNSCNVSRSQIGDAQVMLAADPKLGGWDGRAGWRRGMAAMLIVRAQLALGHDPGPGARLAVQLP
jgi:hypothetical protein